MKYFEHDVAARRDDKIRLLRHQCSGSAVDCYWALLELIYELEDGFDLQNKAAVYSFILDLEITEEQLRSWIEAMAEIGLICFNDDVVTSTRAADAVSAYHEKIEHLSSNRTGKTNKRKSIDNQLKNNCLTNDNQLKNKSGDIKIKKEIESKEKKYQRKETEFLTEKTDEQLPSDNTEAFAQFLKESLETFNSETKSHLPVFDPSTQFKLQKIYDRGRTVEDLILVIRSKMTDWGKSKKYKRYIRPSTLFGDHFEEYLMAAKEEGKKRHGEFGWNP